MNVLQAVKDFKSLADIAGYKQKTEYSSVCGRTVIQNTGMAIILFIAEFRQQVINHVWNNRDDGDRAEYVITELINNAFEHGNNLDASRHIHLNWKKESNGFFFQVADEGKGFLIDLPLAPPHLTATRGRGLWSIQGDVHEISIQTNTISVIIKGDWE